MTGAESEHVMAPYLTTVAGISRTFEISCIQETNYRRSDAKGTKVTI